MLDGVWNKMSITQKMCLLSAFTLMQNLLTINNKDPFEQHVRTGPAQDFTFIFEVGETCAVRTSRQ